MGPSWRQHDIFSLANFFSMDKLDRWLPIHLQHPDQGPRSCLIMNLINDPDLIRLILWLSCFALLKTLIASMGVSSINGRDCLSNLIWRLLSLTPLQFWFWVPSNRRNYYKDSLRTELDWIFWHVGFQLPYTLSITKFMQEKVINFDHTRNRSRIKKS